MRSVILLAAAAVLSSTAAAAKAPVPRLAKEFVSTDQYGKKLALSSYKGKVLVVQFLITTCSHCQAMSQMLTRLQAELGPKGFQAVGVAFNEANADMVKAYIADNHVGIPVGFASRDAVLDYLGVSVMERMSVPQVVIIDRTGHVQAQSDTQGTPELQDQVRLRERLAPLLGLPVRAAK